MVNGLFRIIKVPDFKSLPTPDLKDVNVLKVLKVGSDRGN
jgi:hypothetical protein